LTASYQLRESIALATVLRVLWLWYWIADT